MKWSVYKEKGERLKFEQSNRWFRKIIYNNLSKNLMNELMQSNVLLFLKLRKNFLLVEKIIRRSKSNVKQNEISKF